jgi:hypothetical protein
MVESLSRAYSDKGMHVGLIHVEGPVAPEARNLNPQSITEVAWRFFERGEGLRVHIKEYEAGRRQDFLLVVLDGTRLLSVIQGRKLQNDMTLVNRQPRPPNPENGLW